MDRRRINHEHGRSFAQMFLRMADVKLCSAGSQLKDFFVLHGIRAMNTIAGIEKQMGQAAHSAAARADQINRRASSGATQQRVNLFRGQATHWVMISNSKLQNLRPRLACRPRNQKTGPWARRHGRVVSSWESVS